MSRTEESILKTLAVGGDMVVYRECTKSLLSLKNAGYINCNLDMQNKLITASITPLGRKILSQLQ